MANEVSKGDGKSGEVSKTSDSSETIKGFGSKVATGLATALLGAAILALFSMHSSITRLEEKVSNLTATQVNGTAIQNAVNNQILEIQQLRLSEKTMLSELDQCKVHIEHLVKDEGLLRQYLEDARERLKAVEAVEAAQKAK